MLRGSRFRLFLTSPQELYVESVGAACRALWNVALEQRRAAWSLRHRHIAVATQCAELPALKCAEPRLADAPAHALIQTLRDLDYACRQYGVLRVNWRSRRRWQPSFRIPEPRALGEVRRLSRRWGEVRLPKLGRVRFRWTRPIGGALRHATVKRDGDSWFISFCVDDGRVEAVPNGLPPVGIDRGVVVPLATSGGQHFPFVGMPPGEQEHLRRLHKRLSRQQKGSNRRRATVRAMGRVYRRARLRRTDFGHQRAHELTTAHGLVAIEDLRVTNMMRSARGTVEQPGRNVRQKAGLNRAILDKAWGALGTALEWHGRKNGCDVVAVPAAFRSQTCSSCGHVAAESRESQARFRCVACGFKANADVNAAKVILGAGLALTGRGDFGVARSTKRQPPEREVAYAAD